MYPKEDRPLRSHVYRGLVSIYSSSEASAAALIVNQGRSLNHLCQGQMTQPVSCPLRLLLPIFSQRVTLTVSKQMVWLTPVYGECKRNPLTFYFLVSSRDSRKITISNSSQNQVKCLYHSCMRPSPTTYDLMPDANNDNERTTQHVTTTRLPETSQRQQRRRNTCNIQCTASISCEVEHERHRA